MKDGTLPAIFFFSFRDELIFK